jgi:hypothetical protein
MDAMRTVLAAVLSAVKALTKTWNWQFDIITRQCFSQIAMECITLRVASNPAKALAKTLFVQRNTIIDLQNWKMQPRKKLFQANIFGCTALLDDLLALHEFAVQLRLLTNDIRCSSFELKKKFIQSLLAHQINAIDRPYSLRTRSGRRTPRATNDNLSLRFHIPLALSILVLEAPASSQTNSSRSGP